jgi:Putative MetA-pathway of phenol degradation/AcrB/AcrD/AcrF family
MNAIIAFALRLRALMVALFVLVMIGGVTAFVRLNIEAYPDPVPPLVDIVTQNPGQSAEEIERYITIPIEVDVDKILSILYLGVKLALTEQKGWLPATVVIPQMTVPTGSAEVTAGRVLPGVNVDFGWEVNKDVFNIELLIANNFVQDELGNSRHELATGLTGVFQLTKKLEVFAEWDAFYPTAGASPASRHYAVGGTVYFVTPNLQLDMRAGVGLNHHSNNFLAGVGFAARY